MVHFQDFISECLHHHTFSNMLFNMIFKAHCTWILSCFGIWVSVWLIVQSIFLTFWLSSLIFSTMLWMCFKLPHPWIAGFPNMCAHIPLTLWVSTSYVVPMTTSKWRPMMQFATPLLALKKKHQDKKWLWWKMKIKRWQKMGG